MPVMTTLIITEAEPTFQTDQIIQISVKIPGQINLEITVIRTQARLDGIMPLRIIGIEIKTGGRIPHKVIKTGRSLDGQARGQTRMQITQDDKIARCIITVIGRQILIIAIDQTTVKDGRITIIPHNDSFRVEIIVIVE